MAGLNLYRARITTLGYQQNVQRVDLPRDVNLHAIYGRLTAQIDIAAGGGNDGTLLDEGVQRFISAMRVSHDGVNRVVPIDGRIAYQLLARSAGEVAAAANLAGAGVQAATAVAFDFIIPFARPWLAQPILTCLPGTLRVNQELALYVNFAAARTNSTDSLGSGAFITGGDRVITISNVELTLEAEYSTGIVAPWYLPQIDVRETAQISAANALLPLDMTGADPYDSILFTFLEGANAARQDAFNFLTFQSSAGNVQYYRDVNALMLQRRDLGLFPAVVNAQQTGRIFIRHADNGLLGSVVVPQAMPQPQYIFNVDAPTGAPGVVQAVVMSLKKLPGITSGAS
jgi:hypothetical protein